MSMLCHRVRTVHVIVGQVEEPGCLTLKTPLHPGPTLDAFYAAAIEIFDNGEFYLKLPGFEANVFNQVIRHLNHLPLEDLDTGRHNPKTYVSGWCVLHVLAVNFDLPVLAEESRWQYEHCRRPHWQGCWLPLPGEIIYLYDAQPASRGALKFLVRRFVELFFSSALRINLRDVASLISCHESFAFDIMRAWQTHLTLRASDCVVRDCRVHEQWRQLDAGFVECPISPSGTPCTEITETTLAFEPTPRSSGREEDVISEAEAAETLARLRRSVEPGRIL